VTLDHLVILFGIYGEQKAERLADSFKLIFGFENIKNFIHEHTKTLEYITNTMVQEYLL
jgi:hypothetical protein